MSDHGGERPSDDADQHDPSLGWATSPPPPRYDGRDSRATGTPAWDQPAADPHGWSQQGWSQQNADQPGWSEHNGAPNGWDQPNAGQPGWGQQGAGQQGWGQQDAAQQSWGQQDAAQQSWGQQDAAQQGWGQQSWGEPAGNQQDRVQPAAPDPWEPAGPVRQTWGQQPPVPQPAVRQGHVPQQDVPQHAWTRTDTGPQPRVDPGRPTPGSTQAWVPQQSPPRRRSRRSLLLGLIALLVVALVGGGLFFLLRSDAPTWDGRTIAQPDEVLSDAEGKLDAYAQGRNGATGDDSHCWFRNSDAEGRDVADAVVCGPVLFVDGDPAKQYLEFGLAASGGSGDATLTVSDQPETTDPVALPDRDLLTRPDGTTPPDGAGGLDAPRPPRADPGYTASGPLDDVDFTAPAGAAGLVGPASTVAITGLARPDRVGTGDDARRPAEGEVFLAVRYTLEPGAGMSDAPPTLAYQVGDAAPVPVDASLVEPGATVEAVVSAPNDVTAADLVVTDGVFVQTLSLLDGTPGAGNIAVLTRQDVSQAIDSTQSVSGNASLAGSPGSTPVTLTLTLTAVRLQWFPGTAVTAYPSSADRAFLMLDDQGTTGLEGSTAGRSPSSLWSLQLPDGTVVTPQDLAPDPSLIATGFDVPADFTTGTLVFGGAGTYIDGVLFDTAGATVQFPIDIAAG